MHVAIIMDGNGRWATERGLPRVFGHRAGVPRVEECVRAAPDLGIKELTLFAFSTENWKRPRPEIVNLFRLMRIYFNRKARDLYAEGVRVRFIGRREALPKVILDTIDYVESLTRDRERLLLNIAVDYGGRDEILRAAGFLIEASKRGELPDGPITEVQLKAMSDLPDATDPDLIIRTGGDRRISNFMLWHAAYSEIEFTPELWPDFTKTRLGEIIGEFAKRERRFGAVAE
jgi:undecaprenyl diphosphate synthase